MIYDFHTHTFLSDGVLSPIEQIRRAVVLGYRAIALTDHAAEGELEMILPVLIRDCALAERYWDIIAIPGVELTHVPPPAIPQAAQKAKALGAKIVVVHGETIVEPVPPGTNQAAIAADGVDILAHPGLVTLEEARDATHRGVLLELSSRRGHSLTNGHVAKVARQSGAMLIVDSDAHAPEDLLTLSLTQSVARGAGLEEAEVEEVLQHNPQKLLAKLCLLR